MSSWLAGTTPLWTIVALGYCLASIYLRAIDDYDHPIWVWFPFLFVGSALFMMVNQHHLLANVENIGSAFEIATIIAAAALGHTMFVLARDRAKSCAENEALEDELREYKQLIDRHDIEIDDDER